MVTWENVQELVLSNPARRKVMEKRTESEENIVLQSNGKIRENEGGKKMNITKNKQNTHSWQQQKLGGGSMQPLSSWWAILARLATGWTTSRSCCVCVCVLWSPWLAGGTCWRANQGLLNWPNVTRSSVRGAPTCKGQCGGSSNQTVWGLASVP